MSDERVAQDVCAFEGCGRPVLARGFCDPHYQQWKKRGHDVTRLTPVRFRPKLPPREPCAVEGCGRPRRSELWCVAHTSQWRDRGRDADRVTTIVPRGPSPMVRHDDYAEIVLVAKDGSEVGRARIDIEDVALVGGYRWSALIGKRTTYVQGYPAGRRTKLVLLHRLIMGAQPGVEVDHWDGNGLNNRRENLKLVDRKANMENESLLHNNTSGYRGVTWDAERGRWQAKVKHDGRHYFVGRFDDVHEAGRAAHEVRERLYSNHQTRERR